jgi:hypothetical protein
MMANGKKMASHKPSGSREVAGLPSLPSIARISDKSNQKFDYLSLANSKKFFEEWQMKKAGEGRVDSEGFINSVAQIECASISENGWIATAVFEMPNQKNVSMVFRDGSDMHRFFDAMGYQVEDADDKQRLYRAVREVKEGVVPMEFMGTKDDD